MAELTFRTANACLRLSGSGDCVEIDGKLLCNVNGSLSILNKSPAKKTAPRPELAREPVAKGVKADAQPETS